MMTSDLFVGVGVVDYPKSLQWYEQLLGYPPAFFPHETEAVWKLGEQQYLYVVQKPEHASHALLLLFVKEFDVLVEEITQRGLAPVRQESLPNNVRKIIYQDPDGNEIGFGGVSQPPA